VDVKSKVTSAHPLCFPENSEGKLGETANLGIPTLEGDASLKGHMEQSAASGQRAFRVFATSERVVFTRRFPTVEMYTRSIASVSQAQVKPVYSEISPLPITSSWSHEKSSGRLNRSDGLLSLIATYFPETLNVDEEIEGAGCG
jgi:hypothetical protein